MHALDENPDRRFIYVEIGFFRRWWNHQTKDMQNKVKKFVNEGRLEFISGGWCMNDEASTHYSSIIDQHSLGAEFLHEQFGECGRPKIGWQIDPFGHSREQASIFALMGFDGLFLGRIDHEDYTTRFRTKTMEMVWKASSNLDRQSWLFTGVLPNRYVPPDSFCFDQRCSNDPIMAQGYATNHIIMTFGGDFHYEIAHEAFKNIDKLIEYVNAEQVNGSIINVFYSTPSCYLYALNKVDRAWTTKTDDFFPYARYSNGYWTGYFTSRATLKRYERHSNNILQATRQLNAFANLNERNNLFVLSDAMGIVQHHDAITGTETEEVAFDYAQRLSNGIGVAENVINKAYSKLLPKDGRSPPASNQFLCQLSNISQCLEIDGQERFTLTLWNPTIHPIVQHARVPVKTDYTIRDPTGQTVLSELIPVSQAIQNIPGRTSITQKQIIFKASLPALGFSTYYFEKKLYEVIIGTTDPESLIKYWQRFGYHVGDKGKLSEANALQLYGVKSKLQSIRLRHQSADHGLIRLYIWDKPTNNGLQLSPMKIIGNRWGAMLTNSILRLENHTEEAKEQNMPMYYIPSRSDYHLPFYGQVNESSYFQTSQITHVGMIIDNNREYLNFYDDVLGFRRTRDETTCTSTFDKPSNRMIFNLQEHESYATTDFDDPRSSTDDPQQMHSGRLKIIHFSDKTQLDNNISYANPGSLGYSLYTLRVNSIQMSHEKFETVMQLI
ncbi:unnamed protein product [Rotaria sp. Silwood1]|nr:unnamed protein product [Rotaria sp. Silwood1]